MNDDFPYLAFMEVLRMGRNQLIEDTAEGCSEDLYDALYCKADTDIYNVKMELYELLWIEGHWNRLINRLEEKEGIEKEKKEIISLFANWFKSFVNNWNYSELDILIFEEKMNILRSLISVNNEWEKNIKKMKVSFEKSKKQMKTRIKELEDTYGSNKSSR